LKRYYHVDFSKREFTQRKSYHPEAKVKRMPFAHLLSVSYEEIMGLAESVAGGKQKEAKY